MVAMGTCIGSSYAHLFVGYVEQSLFQAYIGNFPNSLCPFVSSSICSSLFPHRDTTNGISAKSSKYTGRISKSVELFGYFLQSDTSDILRPKTQLVPMSPIVCLIPYSLSRYPILNIVTARELPEYKCYILRIF